MESTTFKTHRLLLLLLVTGMAATGVAWQQKQKAPTSTPVPKTAGLDTLPDKTTGGERKIRNLDEALDDLGKLNINIDLEKINVELEKIKPQVAKELAKAGIEATNAINEIDIPKIKIAVDAAMANIDWPAIKTQVDASVAQIDWDKMETTLQKVKEINFDKLNIDLKDIDIELKKIKPELEKNLQKVNVEIEKAKTELKEYKVFVDGLEKEGLINKEAYTIQHKNGELIINGKTQPAAVYNKYKSFLEKHKKLFIEKSKDDFNIDNDN